MRLLVGKKIEEQLLPQTGLLPRPPLAIDVDCKVHDGDGEIEEKSARTWLLAQSPASGGRSAQEKFVLIKRDMLALVRCSDYTPTHCPQTADG